MSNLALGNGRAFPIDRIVCFREEYCSGETRDPVLYEDDIALVHFVSGPSDLAYAPDPSFFEYVGVEEIALSPDGDDLTTWSEDRTVREWDLDSGEELYRQEGVPEQIHPARPRRAGSLPILQPAGTRLYDKRIDFPSGQAGLTWQNGDGQQCPEANDLLALAAREEDRATLTMQCMRTIMDLRVAANERYFVTLNATSGYRFNGWNARNMRHLWSRDFVPVREVTDIISFRQRQMILDPREGALLLGEADELVILDPRNGESQASFRHPRSPSWQSLQGQGEDAGARNFVTYGTLSADASKLITATLRYGESDVWLWDMSSGEVLQRFAHDDELLGEFADGAVLLDEGRKLFSWTQYGTLRLWDVASGEELSQMAQRLPILEVTFYDEENKAVARDSVGVSVWDLNSGEELARFDHLRDMDGATLSTDETRVLTWGQDATARVWNIASGVEDLRIYHEGVLNGAVYLPGENEVLSWSDDGTARVTAIADQQIAMIFDLARFPPGSPLAPPASEREVQPAEIRYLDIAAADYALEPGSAVTIFGWGKTVPEPGFLPYASLMTVQLEVLDNLACAELEGMGTIAPSSGGEARERINPGVFCARDEYQKTCRGDSGGPVVQGNTLVGVVSWGKSECSGTGEPGVYARISEYSDWIYAHTGANVMRNQAPPGAAEYADDPLDYADVCAPEEASVTLDQETY